MSARFRAVGAALLLAACACDPGGERPPADPPRAAALPVPESAAAAPPPRESAAELGAWSVGPEGIGPVRIGMDFAALAPHLRVAADTAKVDGGCAYLSVRDAPGGVGFMVEQRRLVRVDVIRGRTATAAGARIGDPEERIRALYPHLRTEPHKYTAGQYLIAFPAAPADTLHRIVFETDGRLVERYRAGVFPPVSYVEGCG